MTLYEARDALVWATCEALWRHTPIMVVLMAVLFGVVLGLGLGFLAVWI